MAISKKGLRPISVENKIYFWKFHEKRIVFPNENPNAILIIDFVHFDIWLYTNNKGNRPPNFEPKSVTPSFVADSIQFALKNGWQEEKMNLTLRNNNYAVSNLSK